MPVQGDLGVVLAAAEALYLAVLAAYLAAPSALGRGQADPARAAKPGLESGAA